ncbi:MAG: M20 family metallopeptidase [Alphaproteobacteria bacterium]|nr:M20 family metallopeptidase [Alphaproteobacteria bacterium]
MPSALDIASDLIRMDTRNPPGREAECAHYLGGLLEAAGLEVSCHDFAPGRTSLTAVLRGGGGAAERKKSLCFGGHIDVVPLGAKGWSVDPFGAEIIDGRLYGRGSTDMKSGIAAFVHAAMKLAAEGARGDADIVLAICAGEETGCEGSSHLGRTGALGEAGAIVIAEPTANYPILGHKGALWLRVETEGVTAHGSMPERGVNAIYRAARAVAKLEHFDFNMKPHELLGRPTLNVGTIEGGQNLNSVPDRAAFTVDIRTLPEQDHDGIVSGLEGYLGGESRIERIVDVGGVHTPHSHPWVREVYRLMEALTGEPARPRGAPYFTDASALTPACGNPPTVILGPGEMHMAHQTDEYCPVAHIVQAAEVYETLARRWRGG